MQLRVTRLVQILQEYAPDDRAKQMCIDMVEVMLSENMSERKMELHLASALVDGLRHDNWPWNVYTVRL